MCSYLTALAVQILQTTPRIILKKQPVNSLLLPDIESPLLMGPVGVGVQGSA